MAMVFDLLEDDDYYVCAFVVCNLKRKKMGLVIRWCTLPQWFCGHGHFSNSRNSKSLQSSICHSPIFLKKKKIAQSFATCEFYKKHP